MDISYPNKLKVTDNVVFFNTWYEYLKDYDYSFVRENLHNHIKTNKFLPSVSDLITDYKKSDHGGRYVPDVRTTMLEMQQKEQERYLALTTNVTNVSPEQIQAAKEKALKTIANAVKRSEEENPYKVVE